MGAAVVGETVEVGVGTAVRGLPGAAPDRGPRGEEDERVQRVVAQELVEVGRAQHLGVGDVGELVEGQLRERRETL